MEINTIFMNQKPVIGVVHLLPLPGSPKFKGDRDEIVNRALEEVKILKRGGVDGIIVENFHDMPFLKGALPLEQYGLMASILTLTRKEVNIPLGVNVHFNDWKAEITLAYTCKAQFIRVEAFVDTVITNTGIVEPCCSEVTRYRKLLNIDKADVQIWADIHPKYSKLLLPYPLTHSAQMAEEALADCVIVTGDTTGHETHIDDIKLVKDSINLPVFAGSGVNLGNLNETLKIADGIIVGSAFKESRNTWEMVSIDKITKFVHETSLSR
jgi:membrane complex biogenesis BtpA family protein